MKIYNPTTPGRRGMTGVDYSALRKPKQRDKKLVHGFSATGGRSRAGRITVRFRGSGNKRLHRTVDFGQEKLHIPGKVESLEYDPNRTAFIAKILYRDGDRRYVLAPHGLAVGREVMISEQVSLKVGNRLPLAKIPVGMEIHNIELVPGRGGQIARSAGGRARVLAHEGGFVHVVLPSSEVRKIHAAAFASIGILSNPHANAVTMGKAGRVRWKGRRPHVRGSAMNPRDHPHGGGEGRAPIGMKYPKTKWGKPALGVKTRKRLKVSDKYILQRRKKKR